MDSPTFAPRVSVFSVLLLLVGVAGCDVETQNRVTTELIRPVVVSFEGVVTDAESRTPMPAMQVLLESLPVGAESAAEGDAAVPEPKIELTIETDESGYFHAADIGLDIQNREYALVVRDPGGVYLSHEIGRLFAVSDTHFDFQEVRLRRAMPNYTTRLVGEVREATAAGRPIREAIVNLVDTESGGVPFSASTDENGRFVIEGVVVRHYELEVQAVEAFVADVPTSFATERVRLRLTRADEQTAADGAKFIDVGTQFLVQEAETEDLRILLSWPAPKGEDDAPYDLDLVVYFPGPDCDINHLNGAELNIDLSAETVSPASGFGTDTCYWPAFLHGEMGDRDRETLNAAEDHLRVRHPDPDFVCETDAPADEQVAGTQTCIVASHEADSRDGTTPELITIRKDLMLTEWPKALGYHYDFKVNEAGDTVRHYPVGVAIAQVLNKSISAGRENLTTSRAELAVYQGNEEIGVFKVPGIDMREEMREWTVLMIEIGFKVANPATTDDIYFRVIPFDAFDHSTKPEHFAWEDRRAARAVDLASGERTSIVSAWSAVEFEGALVVGARAATGGDSAYGLFELESIAGKSEWDWRAPDEFPRTVLANAMVHVGHTVFVGDGAFNSGIHEFGRPDHPAQCDGNVHSLMHEEHDAGEALFVGTSTGLHAFDGMTCGNSMEMLGHAGDASDFMAPTGNVFAMHEYRFPEGDFLLAGSDDSPMHSAHIEDFRWQPAVPGTGGEALQNSGASVLSLATYAGGLMAGTNQGLWYFSPMEMKWIHFDDCGPEQRTGCIPRTGPGAAIFDLESYDGTLFVATDDGLFTFNPLAPDLGHGDVLSRFERFPTGVQVNALVTYAGRMYALTEGHGIFFIR